MQITAPIPSGLDSLQSRLDRSLQRLSRRGKWRKSQAKKVKQPPPTASVASAATVSQETRDRLITEALQHPDFEDMTPEEVSAFVSSNLDALIAPYPCWYGHLAKDRPKKQATDAQRAALEKARQRKAAIQHEVDAPYDPAREEEGV